MTRQEVEDKIDKVEFYHYKNKVTVCFMTMKNGYIITGTSGVVDDATEFDRILGEQFAQEDAFHKAWALEGYVEQNKLKGNE